MGRLNARMLPAVLLLGLAACASAPAPRGVNVDLVATEQLAEQAYRQGNYVLAAKLYVDIVEAMPDQADYWYRLGNAYAQQGLSQQASLSYQQSLALDPGNARGWHNLGMMHLKLAHEAFDAGEKRGSKRARVHEENRRLAEATSRVMQRGDRSAPATAPATPAAMPVVEPTAIEAPAVAAPVDGLPAAAEAGINEEAGGSR